MKINIKIETATGAKTLPYELKGAVICGYTGRDTAAIQKHIDELEEQGIAPPPTIPMLFPKSPLSITSFDNVYVEGIETSGEAEYVLLLNNGDVYVGVGSDHTDRELEKHDIPKSKQICPAFLHDKFWNFDEIKDHWDKIEIRSWYISGGERVLYQESTLVTILPPDELIEVVNDRVEGEIDGYAIFSGTPPILTDGFLFGDRFEAELFDPVLNRKLEFAYEVDTYKWFKQSPQ